MKLYLFFCTAAFRKVLIVSVVESLSKKLMLWRVCFILFVVDNVTFVAIVAAFNSSCV